MDLLGRTVSYTVENALRARYGAGAEDDIHVSLRKEKPDLGGTETLSGGNLLFREVKWTKRVSFTRQIRDYIAEAGSNGVLVLWVKPTARKSKSVLNHPSIYVIDIETTVAGG